MNTNIQRTQRGAGTALAQAQAGFDRRRRNKSHIVKGLTL